MSGEKVMRRYRVLEPRKTPYAEPINFARGEMVAVGREFKGNPAWPGWIWCEAEERRCWVPVQIITKKGKNLGILTEDYTATELNVAAGDIIVAERELNGWVWGKRPGGGCSGWVPLDILETADSPPADAGLTPENSA
jgi:hypothetical protein